MPVLKNKIYIFLLLASVSGFTWLYLNMPGNALSFPGEKSVCPVKNLTGLPCPSCGSTRSAVAILNGDFINGLYLNPLGFLVLFFMVMIPLWILFDLLKNKNSLVRFYSAAETQLKKKKIIISFFVLIALNWFWNIYKAI
jgi:hypothetical protein